MKEQRVNTTRLKKKNSRKGRRQNSVFKTFVGEALTNTLSSSWHILHYPSRLWITLLSAWRFRRTSVLVCHRPALLVNLSCYVIPKNRTGNWRLRKVWGQRSIRDFLWVNNSTPSGLVQWLTLHVSLANSRGAHIFGKYYFYMCLWGCFQMKLAFKSMDSVKQFALLNVVGIIQSLEGPKGQKKEQSGPSCLRGDMIFPCLIISYFQVFELGLSYTTAFLGLQLAVGIFQPP